MPDPETGELAPSEFENFKRFCFLNASPLPIS